MIHTTFTEMLGLENPVVGFNRSPAVVAEVSRAGGLGVLAATAYGPAELDAQLSWIEERLDGRPYGVDLLVPTNVAAGDTADLVASLRAQIPERHQRFVAELLRRYDVPETPGAAGETVKAFAANLDPQRIAELLDVAFSHPIALVANALGTPPPSLVERARDAGVVVASLVGKPEHARRQLEAGVDVLVAQGTEAGGHTGTIATTVLTPEVVDLAGDTPVLAAGGIASGRQMAAALALGAAGVWTGSVWLSSQEDIAPDALKHKFLAAASSDTVRSPARTGKPARQLRSAWHDEWEREDSPAPLPMPLQPLLAAEAWDRIDAAADAGNPRAMELESFFVGQVVGGFTELRPTQEIMRALVTDCEKQIELLAGMRH
ncbi:nitronate monooxygenase [Streptomyces sp. NPDC051985]|uniref:nitronate monooxygenase n=1 Tax=Streptomyces sp. NPDC051985 TaxID=3155807 RepID=UPI00342F4076